MAKITVQIPDGLDEEQTAELTGWLSMKAEEAALKRLACEDDPAFRAKVSAKIQQSIDEIESGQRIDARQSMREIADEFGINLYN